MRLKSVRIFGFKTFADRTEVNLDGGVIAVVGPNGCGKSNLVDAILWGLGEANARHLRAQTGQDVIFSGSAKRKGVGFAEVSLLFDNEDGALPIDTPEVVITRRLSRSGDSDYSINRRSCRQRDIYDLLADSGLGRAGYAIVGQKEIDAALSASAEDRRAWIDEAAGVQRYRSRKIEALRRLDQAHDHLARVADIVRELTAQREPLREEAEAAVRFKHLQGTLQDIEIGLLVQDVVVSVRELRQLEGQIEESIRLARAEITRAEALEVEGKSKGSQISEIELEMDSIRGVQQTSLTAAERAEANLRLAHQRLESFDDQERNLTSDGSEAQARIAEAEAELEKLTSEEQADRDALDELRSSLAGVGDAARSLTKRLRELEAELVRARDLHGRRLKADAEAGQRDERRRRIQRELSGLSQAMPDLAEAVATANSAVEEWQSARSGLTETIRNGEARLLALRQEEDRDAQTVRTSLSERAALEGRRRGIEATIDAHEGLTQGARAVIEAAERGLIDGSFIPVGEAIETERDVALAVETALGGSANDLIVEHEREAKAAVEWLKQHRAGRATFQPIPLMRPFEASFELRRLLGEAGIVGRASELVKYSPRHRPVIESLLGRVVVVETLDDALRHAKTTGWARMVTLDGEVVHSSGAVTGGQQARQGYGLVQRKADLAELETQIEELAKTVREFDGRSAKRAAERQRLDEALAESRGKLQALDADAQESRDYHQALANELKGAQRDHDRLSAELKSLEVEAVALPEVDLEALEASRDVIVREVASKSADAEQAEVRLREAESRLQQAQSRLYAAKRRLEVSREVEAARLRRAENLEPERDRTRSEIAHWEALATQAQNEKVAADKRLEELQIVRRMHLEESLRLAEEAKDARANAASVADAGHQAEINRARADSRRAAALQRLFEEYGLTEDDAFAQEGMHEVPADAATVVAKLRRELRAMGDVNLGAIEAYERLTVRLEELSAQEEDVRGGITQVEASIRELDKLTRERFVTTFERVQETFSEMFTKLFGSGEGKMSLSDPDRILESGIEIDVTLPGKRRQQLNLLSGGERALCTSAFLFALLKVKPSPLVVLDEVDAPLDGRNVERFAATLHDFTDHTQFIVITHNPTTIASAPVWLGVSMQEPGVSTLVPVHLPREPVPA